jgi:ATP-binding cassette, subfamily B, multidrug efflux pump
MANPSDLNRRVRNDSSQLHSSSRAEPKVATLAAPKKSQLIRLLRQYLARYKRWLIVVLVLQAAQSLATLYLPHLNADIINKGVATGDTGYIWSHGAQMLVIAAVQVCLAVGAVYFGSRIAAGFGRDVRARLFHQVTEFSGREVAHFGASTLITRVTNDVQQVQVLVQMTCAMLLAAPFTVVGGVFMAMRQNVGLSIVPAIAIPILLFIIGNVLARMVPNFRVMQTNVDEMNRVLREQITGLRVVRAFVREPSEMERFEVVNREVERRGLRGGRLMGAMFPTAMMTVNLASTAVIWYGAVKVDRGSLTLGGLVAYISYLTSILMSVMMSTYIAALAPRAAVSADRIEEVLDASSSLTVPEHPITPAPGPAALVFNAVGFGYPGAEHLVIDDVSFACEPGRTVGSTGAGKTTLVHLAARLFDVTHGSIRLAGVDVRQLSFQDLTDRIALVPQRPYLFSGTVATNLRFGRGDATDAELWQALEVAQAGDFVRAMDGGLDAPISQGGTNVSGGQRQRLAIARALVRKPAVYLFDDSFSALDVATDARLRAALVPYTADATVLVVAQRVSTIVNADHIVVIEGGSIVGQGTHAELTETCPTYVEIVRSQLGATETVGAGLAAAVGE